MRRIRPWLLVVGLLLLLAAFAMAQTQEDVSVDYGSTKDFALELNSGDTALLDVRVVDIPDANVSQMYVQYDSSTRDRVFCAPSPKAVNDDTEHFTCVITPGDAFEGDVTFVALDANGNVFSDNTRLHLTVTYEEQWFSAKTVAKVGSTVSVGGYSLEVKSASFLYVNLVVSNSPVTAFVNDETKVTDDLYVVYKGFDPDTKEVFLEFKSHKPITVSVSEVEYYLVAPRDVYYSDDNTVTIDVVTNCSAVEYRPVGSDEWEKVDVEDGSAKVELSSVVSRVYLRCADDDSLSRVVYLHTPSVVKVEPDENTFVAWCESHDYIPKDQCPKTDCSSYCTANGWVKPPAGYRCEFVPVGQQSSGDNSRLFFGIVALVVLAGLFYLYKQGKIKLPRKPSATEVVEKPRPLEEAHDIQ